MEKASDLPPVHTIFPERKIKVAVLGDFNLKTNPGNCSGFHSVSGNFLVTSVRSIGWSTDAEATTFSMLTIGLVAGITFSYNFDLYITPQISSFLNNIIL